MKGKKGGRFCIFIFTSSNLVVINKETPNKKRDVKTFKKYILIQSQFIPLLNMYDSHINVTKSRISTIY